MATAISNVSSICQAYDISEQMISFYNRTNFTDPDQQLPWVICEIAQYKNAFQHYFKSIRFGGHLWGAIICLISAFLALTGLCAKEFTNAGFVYYKAINSMEIVHGVFMAMNFASRKWWPATIETAIGAFYAAHIFGRLELFIPLFIELCVLWASISLVLGFSFPGAYRKLNSQPVAFLVLTIILFISVSTFIPNALVLTYSYNHTLGTYMIRRTEFESGQWMAYYKTALASMAFPLLQMIFFLVAMASVVWAAIMNNRKMKTLLQANGQETQVRHARTTKTLCVFQLLEVAPFLVSCFLRALLALKRSETDLGRLVQMPYHEAATNVQWLHVSVHLLTIQYLSFLFCHCTHFIRYTLFSRGFRKACGNGWLRCMRMVIFGVSSIDLAAENPLGNYLHMYSAIEQPDRQDTTSV